MPHTCGNILLHFIFSTHQRRPLIKPEFRADLVACLGGIVREMNGAALIVDGTADHVHMLVGIRPTHSAAEIVRVIKANSSKWVRARHTLSFAPSALLGGARLPTAYAVGCILSPLRGCDNLESAPGVRLVRRKQRAACARRAQVLHSRNSGARSG